MTASNETTLKASKGSSPESSPAVSLRVAVARIYRALRNSSDYNITPSQASALARIEQSEPVRIGVLANLEGITPASMSKIIDSMSDQDFIVREPDPLDGRVSMVRIAPSGREMIHEIRSKSTRALEDALSSLSAREQSIIHSSLPVLEKLAEVLQTRQDS
jgi:DNA-binding MarR family transcriptional regulator